MNTPRSSRLAKFALLAALLLAPMSYADEAAPAAPAPAPAAEAVAVPAPAPGPDQGMTQPTQEQIQEMLAQLGQQQQPPSPPDMKVVGPKIKARLAFLPEVLATYDTDKSVTRDSFIEIVGPALAFVLDDGMTDDKIKAELKGYASSLVDFYMLLDMATAAGVPADPVAAQAKIAEIKAKYGENALQGEDEAKVAEQIGQEEQINGYFSKVIDPQVKVEDADILQFYTAHQGEFAVPATVHAFHILKTVKPNATAEEKAAALEAIKAVKARLAAGEDFSAVARQVSDCPSKAQGGDLDTFPRGSMVKPFEDVAFALKPNETSDIVETQFGYHIIRVTEVNPAGITPLEGKLKEDISSYLKERATNDLIKKTLADERTRLNLKLNI